MLAKRFILPMCVLLSVALIAGCGEPDGHDDQDEHAKVTKPGGDGANDGHGSGHADKLGPVTIAGRQVTVTLFGDLKAGATVHGDIKVAGDPVDAVRGWVGAESGEGSLKSKAGGSGGGYHINLEAPEQLGADAKVWIELEINGEAHLAGLAMPSH